MYYQNGVGTDFGVLSRMFSGAFGVGLEENVREAYGFLANNYYPGDSVVLVCIATVHLIFGLLGFWCDLYPDCFRLIPIYPYTQGHCVGEIPGLGFVRACVSF